MTRFALLTVLLPGLALAQNGDKKGHDNMAPVVPASEISPSPVLPVVIFNNCRIFIIGCLQSLFTALN